jgi:hypothetical protein
MAPINEGQHTGEFIVSELPSRGSRSTGTLSSGQNLTDGQCLGLSGGELVALPTTLNSAGELAGSGVVGILIGDWDASATGTNADIPDVPYLDWTASVKEDLITFPAGANPKAATIRGLKAKGIKVLDTL